MIEDTIELRLKVALWVAAATMGVVDAGSVVMGFSLESGSKGTAPPAGQAGPLAATVECISTVDSVSMFGC